VQPYGIKKLVHIAKDSSEFISAIEQALALADKEAWLKEVDGYLKQISWDKTYNDMQQKIKNTIEALQKLSIAS
jgi:hypothetical protein